MNQGRLLAFAALFAAALTPPAAADAPFKMTFATSDHVSGLYHVKTEAKVVVTVDNVSKEAQEFSGEIAFGPASGEQIRALSVTPVQPVKVQPGQRVKVPLSLTFGAAGAYELRWRRGADQEPIAPERAGVVLHCIFAPRAAKADDSPWIAVLPPGVVDLPGLLTDYMGQTTVRRFLLDERFAYDSRTNVGLGFGASTGGGAAEIDALLVEAGKAKTQFILRVAVPMAEGGNPRVVDAFKTYLLDAIRRSHGTLAAIAITPDLPPDTLWTPAHREAFRAFYLAGYETAKRADRNLLLLGAGSAETSATLLIDRDARLSGYIDALALHDAASDPHRAALLMGERKLPLYILPPRGGRAIAPAAALAQRAAIVPVPPPELDNGATAHLLNGTVFFQRVSIAVPTADPAAPDRSNIPFISVFQGEGYALAAIAGFAAGTDLDAQYPALARSPTSVEPRRADDKPYPNLEVGDDTRSMRVVDAAGAPVDCRIGDHIFVPAEDAVVYLLQAGTAHDLAGSLIPAVANRLPIFEIQAVRKGDRTAIRLQNISTHPQGGTLQLVRPGEQPTVLVTRDLAAIPTGKEMELEIARENLSGTLVAEIVTSGAKSVTQRTAIVLP